MAALQQVGPSERVLTPAGVGDSYPEFDPRLLLLTVETMGAPFQNVCHQGFWSRPEDALPDDPHPKRRRYGRRNPLSETGTSKFQNHLALDFPIKSPASAKALTEELPPLMPDFAKTQDNWGTVHFSRFMVKGDEKLLFLSDVDGEIDDHIKRLVESAGPVFDFIFKHVEDPPATPVASNRERVVKWLKHHTREPIDTYFAFDASVQVIKAAARAARFTGNTSQSPLLTYMAFKSRVQGLVLKLLGPVLIGEKGHNALTAVGTVHISHFVPFENNQIGFFTIFDGSFEKYIQDFADKTSFTFNALFPNVIGGAPTPVEKNVPAFMQWARENNYPPIGFYSAYPGLSVLDIRALLADRKSQSGTAA